MPRIGEHFDGVEVLLKPNVSEGRIATIRSAAAANDLGLHFHEIWSYANAPYHFINKVGVRIGMISRRTEPLFLQLPAELKEPVVCYPWRYREIPAHTPFQNLLLQTCPLFDVHISYQEMLAVVRERNMGVVFDTQHVLELFFGVVGIPELAKYSKVRLQAALLAAWDDFGPFVKEIHFNNFDPAAGITAGRNFMPDRGVLDLKSFARRVVADEWSGVVTPEVAPSEMHRFSIPWTPLPIPYWLPRLKKLSDITREMFA